MEPSLVQKRAQKLGPSTTSSHFLLYTCGHGLQAALTERALELLGLPEDGESKLILDLGCGSGLSGEALTEAGHIWVVSQALSKVFLWATAPSQFNISHAVLESVAVIQVMTPLKLSMPT